MLTVTAGIVNRKKVLVVDDDPGMCELVQSILVTEGVEVFTATDGEDGIQKAFEMKPDLILLDIAMPKVDGVTFCMAIQTIAQAQKIPIIVITGQTNRHRVQACLKAGADDFLAKPLQMDELLACVGAMFRTSQISDPVDRLHEYILTIRDLRDRSPQALKK
jgi:two-component system alkaline phosphatase synthesis response regulator PhoP